MKKSILSIFMLILATAAFAQAPQAINYQAVARDAGGNIIANQDISFRLGILQGGLTGTAVYSESHLETSNQFGLVTLEIGRGTVISGVFADISWGTNTYYLKTEMDPAGGTSYQEMGTSQFLSVPYAFFADTAQYAKVGPPGGQACGMDICYDNHAPGTGGGRFILADNGAVDIQVPNGKLGNGGLRSTIFDVANPFHAIFGLTNGTGDAGYFLSTDEGCAVHGFNNGGTGYAGYFRVNGSNHALKAEINFGLSTSNAIYAITDGEGSAGYFQNKNFTTGNAIEAYDFNANKSSDLIYAFSQSQGSALNGIIDNATSDAPAISGKTSGPGYGVYGRSGLVIPPGDGAAKIAGVSGESIIRPGIAGYSKESDGVHGGTKRTGTYDDDGNPTTIDAGIHGEPALTVDTDDGDNFGVVGTQSAYNSTGVLGIGGAKGHGVIGIAGGHEGFTTAGIRGFTRESANGWPPSFFPLIPNENKQQIGVFGQAFMFTGVWGESHDGFGVVGTAGFRQTLGDIKVDLPEPKSAGVYGHASEDGIIGVIGKSIVTGPTISSGVRAIGNGPAENAAALTLDNGAVRVAGSSRAAGKKLIGEWFDGPITSADPNDGHNHRTGFYAQNIIPNNLIIPESYIQLTVESRTMYDDYYSFFANIEEIGVGYVEVKVTAMSGIAAPSDSVFVHYWIVNPE